MLLLFLLLGSIAAFLLSSVAGGGAGLLLMPVLVMLLPAASAPAALSIGTATSSASRLMVLRKRIRWDVVRWFVPAAVPAVFVGAWLLTFFPPIYIQVLIVVFLMGNLPAVFRKVMVRPAVLPLVDRPRQLLLVGAAAGILSGFTGAVGLLFNRFYYRLEMDKEEIVATRAANEVLLHIIKLVLYGSFGLLTERALFAGVVVAVGAITASIITPFTLRRLNEVLFRRIGLAAMAIAGVTMTTTSSAQVIAQNQLGATVSVAPREVELTTRGRGRQLSVEVDRIEGPVVEVPARSTDIPTATRIEIAKRVGSGNIMSVEKAISLAGRQWEIGFQRDGRAYEFHLPRADAD